MSFFITVPSSLPVAEASSRLWDARRHTAVIPLTRLNTEGRLDRAGTRFTARTGIGPVAIDDHMEVESATAGRLFIRKRGRWHRGWIEAEVRPWPNGSVVVWRESLQIRWLSLVAQPVIDRAAAAAYRRSIHDILDAPAPAD